LKLEDVSNKQKKRTNRLVLVVEALTEGNKVALSVIERILEENHRNEDDLHVVRRRLTRGRTIDAPTRHI